MLHTPSQRLAWGPSRLFVLPFSLRLDVLLPLLLIGAAAAGVAAGAPASRAAAPAPAPEAKAAETPAAPTPATRTLAASRAVALLVVPAKASVSEDAAAVESLMREELGTLEGVEALTMAAGPRALPASAAQAVEEGNRALNDKQAVPALAAFDRALAGLTASAAKMSVRLLAQALKGKAVALALAGRTDEARPFIRDTLAIWPSQTPGEWAYTPEVMNLFTFTRHAEGERKSGMLEVSTTPPGAWVRVDGKARGATPLTSRDERPGRHWVELAAAGHVRVARWVEVEPETTAKVALTLMEAPNRAEVAELAARALKARRGPEAGEIMEALRASAGADSVIVLKLRARNRKGYELTGWQGTEGGPAVPVKATLARDAGMLPAAQALLSGLLGADVARASAGPPAPLGGPPAPTLAKGATPGDGGEPGLGADGVEDVALYERWWFWAAVGGAVTATAVILAVTLSGDDAAGNGTLGLQIHSL